MFHLIKNKNRKEQEMKPEIMLQNTSKGLMAHFFDKKGNPDPDIIELFGTPILPTPYLGVDSMPEAVRQIKKLNPDYIVSSV